jgi:hypothetical protein
MVTLRGLSGGFAAYKFNKRREGEERGKRRGREEESGGEMGEGLVVVGDDRIGHHYHITKADSLPNEGEEKREDRGRGEREYRRREKRED